MTEKAKAEKALELALAGAKEQFVAICDTGVEASTMVAEFNKITAGIEFIRSWVDYYTAKEKEDAVGQQSESKADS